LNEYISYSYSYTKDGNGNVLNWTKTPLYAGHATDSIVCTYDAQNRALTATFYSYDYETQQFVKTYYYEQAFDAYGNQILFSGIWWIDSNSYGFKYEDAYDADGNQIVSIEYNYDRVTQTFVPESKYEYTFGNVPIEVFGEDGHNPETAKLYAWENGAWTLEMEGKYDWTFDADNHPLTMILSVKTGNEWMWYGTMTWYYSPHDISGISVPATTAKGLHAWVSGGKLQIEGDALKEGDAVQIFDIAGRKAIEGKQRSGQSISVSHLPGGVYIVRVGNQSGKFVKE
jgi:hypothetical protein